MVSGFAVLEMGPAYRVPEATVGALWVSCCFRSYNTAGSVLLSLLCRRDLTLQLLSWGMAVVRRGIPGAGGTWRSGGGIWLLLERRRRLGGRSEQRLVVEGWG